MKNVDPKEFNGNVFKLFDNSWCLVAAYDKDKKDSLKYNAMTASWGGMGVLWNKNVFFCFVRPQRYTKQFIDNSDIITLSFFDDEMREALSYCGSHSGRDGDKLAAAGLDVKITDNAVTFEQAKITVTGKKLFCADMLKENFLDSEQLEKWYKNNDFHTAYVCEILSISTVD